MRSKGRTPDADTAPTPGGLRITVTDESGAPVDVPEQVYRLTREVLSIVAEGGTAAVVEVDHDLTTQTAADILGVSRPHLIKLLDQGEIPYYKVGSHRRLAVADVLDFKRRRDIERRAALSELTALSQELGLY
ncbi:MAG: helix-turn-helix domain-containing protein [Aeromicrobium sp.]|nr:helix-turn-helix domain-containing protein [Aeromicrobium sp.]